MPLKIDDLTTITNCPAPISEADLTPEKLCKALQSLAVWVEDMQKACEIIIKNRRDSGTPRA
jgi:hypothetical protein